MYRKKGRKTVRPTKDEFEKMYYNPEKTVYDLANTYKVNIQTIYNWAFYYRNKQDIE